MNSASFCCLNFDQSSLPALQSWQTTTQEIVHIGSIGALAGSAAIVCYKIADLIVSFLTAGNFTLLGSVIVSSPFFYIPVCCLAGISAIAWCINQICSDLISKIN